MCQMIVFNLLGLKTTDLSLPSGVNTLAVDNDTNSLTPVVTEKI